MATKQEEKWAEERAERTRHDHDSFFDLPADALTDGERRAQWAPHEPLEAGRE